jgi:thymidylate kinase
LVFVVLEGFSGTGKTTLTTGLEKMGWMRLPESAHVVPEVVPVAERANTASDYSLLGATMLYSSVISQIRKSRKIVSEGYLLSDLAYAKVRYDLGKSDAFPTMLAACKAILREESLRPDLYIILEAKASTITRRQRRKNAREKISVELFRASYYSALEEIHRKVGEDKIARVDIDSLRKPALQAVLDVLKERNVV